MIHPPSKPLRSLVLAAVTVAVCATPGVAFHVKHHLGMTKEVLATVAGNPLLGAIAHGSVAPDVQGYFNGYCESSPGFVCLPIPTPPEGTIAGTWSMQHFDNYRIWPANGGIDWVNFLVNDARARVAAYDGSFSSRMSAYRGLVRVGMAMHAVQDFYAHSNYAEFQDGLYTRVDQIPLFEGLDLGGSTVIPPRSTTSSIVLDGIQTGYYLLPQPSWATHHDILNKDDSDRPEGQATWRNLIFQIRGTYFQLVSGQTATNPSYLAQGGLAPRHTLRVWNALVTGASVFNYYPLDGSGLQGANRQVQDLAPQLAAIASDTAFTTITRELSRLEGLYQGDMNSYPFESIDSTDVPRRFSEVANDVWVDFSTTANPAGPWSYGWSDDAGVTFHRNETNAVSPGNLATWSSASGGGSRVAASPIDSVSHEGGTNLSAGSLSLLPGSGGRSAVVRYVAPAAGTYEMSAHFWGQSGYGGTPVTTTDVRVRVNGALTFADSINVAGNATAAAWKGGLPLAAGDRVDFVVGDGGNGAANDATGLHVFVVPSASVSVDDGPRAPAIALSAPMPNPSRGPVRVRFVLPQAGWAAVCVFDLAGREVARFADGPFEAGVHAVEWNGRLESGAAAPPGVYQVRLQTGREFRDARLVIVR